MELPGVGFYIENKKIFRLSSGIQQPKMPVPYEFQGVPITGHKMDTQCFPEVKDSKFNNSLIPEENHRFAFAKGEQFVTRRGMFGHFNSFPAISISQLVGGFVGSKSQIRSVNRETCQIWDVIFRQLVETACQPTDMQNGAHQYYNFSKSFSQNLYNTLCLEGRTALDGIASYLISKNCEFLQEQEMIHSMSVSEFKNKDISIVSPMANNFKAASKVAVSADTHLPVDNFSPVKLVPNSGSSTKVHKQSYAEVAKSIATKPEKNVMQQYSKLSVFRHMKKISEKCEKSMLTVSSKAENQNGLEHSDLSPFFNKNSSKYTKKGNKSCESKKPKISATVKSETLGTVVQLNRLPNINNSPEHSKKMTLNHKEPSCRPTSKTGNWRVREESLHFTYQRRSPSASCSGHKHLNTVYPAFSRKNRTVATEANEADKFECFSKSRHNNKKASTKPENCRYNYKSRSSVSPSEVSTFGRNFKHLPKAFHSNVKKLHDGRRVCNERKSVQFSSYTGGADICKNWRCKHKGVVCCDTFGCEKESFRKNTPVTVPKNIPEPSVRDNLGIITGRNGEGCVGRDDLEDHSQGDEKIGSSDLLPEFSLSIDCISVSSSCGDISDISSSRRRFLSECSVDSEDSFVVMFESECTENMSLGDCATRQTFRCTPLDSDTSDSWSVCDSGDESIGGSDDLSEEMDEIDFCFFSPSLSISAESFKYSENLASPLPDRLKDVNEKWMQENASIPSKDKSPEKVNFPGNHELATVHPMVKWDFAYRTARCGPWEEMARDRARFQARIDRIEPILGPVLTPEHRSRVRQRMDSSAIT